MMRAISQNRTSSSITSGFRHEIGLVESRYGPRELGGHRLRECFTSIGFLSLETVSLPGRQRSHDYNAIQRIDAKSWGHTRGRRRVANPRRVRPTRRRKKSTLAPSPLPPSHLHLLWPALSASIDFVGESIYDLRATSPICTKSLTSLLVIFSA